MGECLLDGGFQSGLEIIRRYRSDQLVGDAPVAPDDERFGHPVHSPFDGRAAVAVGPVGCKRIAVPAEKAPRIVRLVLVIHSDDVHARVRRDRHEQRRFLPARHAPRGPHIEHRDATLKLRTVEAGHRLAVALEAGKRRQIGPRGRMSDEGRGDARRIAGAEPQYEQCGMRTEVHHDGPARMPACSIISVRTRRRMISLRIAARCNVTNNSVNATAMTMSGTRIAGWIAGPPRRSTEAGWCSVFHQSTENLMIGILIAPTSVSTAAARAACVGSSMVRHNASMPRYIRNRTSTEVSRASQTQ